MRIEVVIDRDFKRPTVVDGFNEEVKSVSVWILREQSFAGPGRWSLTVYCLVWC